jgi:hypothetical protein
MPARKRRPPAASPSNAPVDPVTQFAQLLRESNEREEAERDRRAAAKREASDAAKAAAARADALAVAKRDLNRAIAGVREARSTRRGVAEADAAWREAKARLIELETGTAPDWDRSGSAADDGHGDEDDGETA